MTYLFNQLQTIANIIVVALIIVIVFIGIAYFIRENNRKKRKVMNEEMTDYSQLERADTKEYIKIDDIKDNMIIADNGRRFIGVLKCQGFDYYSENSDVKYATYGGFMSYINTIDKFTSFRQYSKPIDMEHTEKKYEKALQERTEEIYIATEDLKDMEANLRDNRQNMTEEQIALFEEGIKNTKKKIESLKFRQYHVADQLRAVQFYSGGNVTPELMQTWVFDWTYDPYDFAVDLSEEEIYQKAKEHLGGIATAKAHALGNAGVKAKRCNTMELIEMCRRYSSPKSSDRYKLSDIINSSYFDDIVTSNSADELRMEVIMEEDFLDDEEIMEETLKDVQDIAFDAINRLNKTYERASEARSNYQKQQELKQTKNSNNNTVKNSVPKNTNIGEKEKAIPKANNNIVENRNEQIDKQVVATEKKKSNRPTRPTLSKEKITEESNGSVVQADDSFEI